MLGERILVGFGPIPAVVDRQADHVAGLELHMVHHLASVQV